MLHVFSTNRVKLMARTPTATIKKGQREYSTQSPNASKTFITIFTTHGLD